MSVSEPTKMKMSTNVVCLLFAVFCQLYIVNSSISNRCLRCICFVESGCNANIHCGDGGASCGPYQIQYNYWNEGGRHGGSYRSCVSNFGCAESTIKGYMGRYATRSRLGYNPTCKDYARIHNGGPNGYKYGSTLGYWKKIQRQGCSKFS